MKVLFIASECAPMAKVGGLADVIGSLPKTLKELGMDVSVVIPFYGAIKLKKDKLNLFKAGIEVDFEGKKEFFDVWKTKLPQSNVSLFLIDNKKFFEGDVYIEKDASSGGSKEEAKRFLFFSVAAIKVAKLTKSDILHCHDWHVGLVPYFIKKSGLNFKTLITIHNMGYQGIYSPKIVNQVLKTDFVETVNCLKEGILSANIINTVSPNYAKEILTKEFGFGLDKYLRKRKKDLFGIINGLDENQFNPESDPYIVKNYSIKNFKNKNENKDYLQKKYFGKKNDLPLIGIIARLTPQKGFDLIRDIFDELMKEKIQMVLLGKGIKEFEDFFLEKARKNPDKFFAKIGFDEKLAHQIYAGANIFLMPSHFEPCGLGQLIAMKYGTIPVARKIGGLKDTIKNVESKTQKEKASLKGTGFLFEKYESGELLATIKKSLKLFENKKIWEQIQKNAMAQDFSWRKSAKQYLKIYKKLTEQSQ